MALGVGVPIPTIATAGVRIVPDLTGFKGALKAGGINQATLGADKLGKVLGGVATAATAVGVASVAAATKAGNAFTAYEKSLTLVQTLTGTAAEVTDEWGDRLLELAPKVGRGPQELADALFFVASAGLEGEVAFEALEASARGAALGLGDTETVADAVTSAIGAYGVENLNAAEAVDILAAAVDRGKVEADALAGSIGRVLPIASAAGVEFEEVGAAIAALSRTGLDAEEAATALRQLFNNIINPSRESKKALADVGLTAEEMRASLDENLLGTLELVRDRFEGNTDALFNLIPNIRAVTGFLSLMGENADSTRAVFDDLANATGFVNERFGILEQSNAFRRDQARAAIQSAFIGEGERSAEAITELFETAAEIIPDLIPDVVAMGEGILQWSVGVADTLKDIIRIKDEVATYLQENNITPEPGEERKPLRLDPISVLGRAAEAATQAMFDQRVRGGIAAEARRSGAEPVWVENPNALLGGEWSLAEVEDAIRIRRSLEQSSAGRAANFQEGLDAYDVFRTQRQDALFSEVGDLGPQVVDGQFFDESIEGFGRLRDEIGTTNEGLNGYKQILGLLEGPNGEVINGWSSVNELVSNTVEGVGNYQEAIQRLTDPTFNAIASARDLDEAFSAALDPESDGGKVVTSAEIEGLLKPIIETATAFKDLDPSSVQAFTDIVTPIIEGLGGSFEDIFGPEGSAPVAIDQFGRIVTDALGPAGTVFSNIEGAGTEYWGPTIAGEMDGALTHVKNALGIDSPSSVWADEVGKPIAQGVAQGFRAGIPEIIAAFGEIPDPSTIPGYGGVNVTIVNPNTRDVVDEASVVASTVTAADIIGRGGR